MAHGESQDETRRLGPLHVHSHAYGGMRWSGCSGPLADVLLVLPSPSPSHMPHSLNRCRFLSCPLIQLLCLGSHVCCRHSAEDSRVAWHVGWRAGMAAGVLHGAYSVLHGVRAWGHGKRGSIHGRLPGAGGAWKVELEGTCGGYMWRVHVEGTCGEYTWRVHRL